MSDVLYVYHGSDLHIRNDGRFGEYVSIIDRFIGKLKSIIVDPDKTIIVIIGDVLHSRDGISEDCGKLLYRLFSGLCKITTTIVIDGNHDVDMGDPTKESTLKMALSTVCANLKNLIYIPKSGPFKFRNITFGVTNVRNREIYPRPNSDSQYVISLCHRSRLEEDDLERLKQYDFCFMGDAHKYKYVNEIKTIGFSGSLIRQRHCEVEKHGFIEWNLESGESRLIVIPNDYDYHSIYVKKGKYDVPELSKNPRIMLVVENTSIMKMHDIIDIMYNEYNAFEVRVKDIVHENATDKTNKKVETYINNPDKRYKLFPPSLQDFHCFVDTKVNKIDYDFGYTEWKILKLSFSNVFCFKGENVIDFSNYGRNSIIQIKGGNGYGKTAIMDIILLAVFGDTSRASLAESMNAADMKCSIEFSINNIRYKITRSGTKTPKGANTMVKMCSFDGDGRKRPIYSKNKQTRKQDIARIMGNMEHCMLTSMYSHNNQSNRFTELQPAGKKKFLVESLGIDLFKNHNAYVKKMVKNKEESVTKLNTEMMEMYVSDKKFKCMIEQRRSLKDGLDIYDVHWKNCCSNFVVDIRFSLSKIISLVQSKCPDPNILSLEKIYSEQMEDHKFCIKTYEKLNIYYTSMISDINMHDLIVMRLRLLINDNHMYWKYSMSQEIYFLERSIEEAKYKRKRYAEIKRDMKEESYTLKQCEWYIDNTNTNSKSSIMKKILPSYIPSIEKNINRRLKDASQNFSIGFVKKKGGIAPKYSISVCKTDTGIIVPNVKADCGYVGFVVNVLLSVTLREMTLLPKSNFLIIDEGWETMDKDRRESMGAFIAYVKKQYDHVFVISHLEHMDEYCDHSINLTRNDDSGFSVIDNVVDI